MGTLDKNLLSKFVLILMSLPHVKDTNFSKIPIPIGIPLVCQFMQGFPAEVYCHINFKTIEASYLKDKRLLLEICTWDKLVMEGIPCSPLIH